MNETEKHKKPPRRPRVEERDPLRAARAIECYAETGSLNATSKTTGLPRSTVKAILTRQGDAFDMVKKVIAERAAVLAETCLEHAQNKAHKLTPYQAVIGAKVSTDHMLLALGREANSPLVNIDLGSLPGVIARSRELAEELAELRRRLEVQPDEEAGGAETAALEAGGEGGAKAQPESGAGDGKA
jgi:hypothetical protein